MIDGLKGARFCANIIQFLGRLVYYGMMCTLHGQK